MSGLRNCLNDGGVTPEFGNTGTFFKAPPGTLALGNNPQSHK